MGFVLRIVCDCKIDDIEYANGQWSNTEDFEMINHNANFLEYDWNRQQGKTYANGFGNSKLFYVESDFNGCDKFLMRLSVRRIGIEKGIFYAWRIDDKGMENRIRAAISECEIVGNEEKTFVNGKSGHEYFHLASDIPFYEVVVK